MFITESCLTFCWQENKIWITINVIYFTTFGWKPLNLENIVFTYLDSHLQIWRPMLIYYWRQLFRTHFPFHLMVLHFHPVISSHLYHRHPLVNVTWNMEIKIPDKISGLGLVFLVIFIVKLNNITIQINIMELIY